MPEERPADKKPLDFFAETMAVDLSTATNDFSPVADNENVAWVMSENLRRLYHLRVKQLDHLRSLVKEHFEERDIFVEERRLGREDPTRYEKLMKLQEIIDPLYSQTHATNRIFWEIVSLDFPETSEKFVGVREGYKIIWREFTPEETTRGALGGAHIFLELIGDDPDDERPKGKTH